MTRFSKRTLGAVAMLAAVAGFVVAGGSSPAGREAAGAIDRTDSASKPSNALSERFAVSSNAHTNRCTMPASALKAMPADSRLQGSCCSPMSYRSYVKQVRGLRRYAAVSAIPKDPYDVSVRLAERLIGYHNIILSPAENRRYNRAVKLSRTKGPCCCQCWRW